MTPSMQALKDVFEFLGACDVRFRLTPDGAVVASYEDSLCSCQDEGPYVYEAGTGQGLGEE